MTKACKKQLAVYLRQERLWMKSKRKKMAKKATKP